MMDQKISMKPFMANLTPAEKDTTMAKMDAEMKAAATSEMEAMTAPLQVETLRSPDGTSKEMMDGVRTPERKRRMKPFMANLTPAEKDPTMAKMEAEMKAAATSEMEAMTAALQVETLRSPDGTSKEMMDQHS